VEAKEKKIIQKHYEFYLKDSHQEKALGAILNLADDLGLILKYKCFCKCRHEKNKHFDSGCSGENCKCIKFKNLYKDEER